MAETFSNFGSSTLAAGINSSQTTITVASAGSFPTTGNFRLRVVPTNELMLVTSVAGTTLTVTRGVESTTAASASSGAVVEHDLTRQGLLNAVAEGSLTALTPSGSLPTASRVLVSDGSGKITNSSVTTTTLGYLDATSSIQTQIDAKADSSSLHAVATSGDYADLAGVPSDIVASTGTITVNDIMVSSDGATTITSSGFSFPLDPTDANQIAAAPVEYQQVVVEYATEWAVANGVGYFVVPPSLNGRTLTTIYGAAITAGSGGGSNSFSVARNGTTITSSQINLAASEENGSAIVSQTLTTNDRLRVDIGDVTGGTAAQGLIVTLVVS